MGLRMTAAQQEAGDNLYRVLKLMPCTCRYEHPYDPRGKLLEQCPQCKALRAWDALPKAVA